jgi:hypothetical protein
MEVILELIFSCIALFFQLFIGIFARILGVLSVILRINTNYHSLCGCKYCQKSCCKWKNENNDMWGGLILMLIRIPDSIYKRPIQSS